MKFTSRRYYDFSPLGHLIIFIFAVICIVLLIHFVPFARDLWESAPITSYSGKGGRPKRPQRYVFLPLFILIRLLFTPFRRKTITLEEDRIIHQKDEILYSDIKIEYSANPFVVSKGALLISSTTDKYISFAIGSRYKNCWIIWEELIQRVKAANPDADIDPQIEQRILQLK